MSNNYNPLVHHRRSIRLKGYDYSKSGAYFVTPNVQHHLCFFGKIIQGEMIKNDAGLMIEKWWIELKNKFPNIELDEFQIMPNHFHGIIIINNVGADLRVCPIPISNEPIPVSDEPIPVSNEPIPISDEPIPISDEPIPVSDEPIRFQTKRADTYVCTYDFFPKISIKHNETSVNKILGCALRSI